MNVYGAQQHAGIFILWYTSLKMALLLHKTALVNFPMATTVWIAQKLWILCCFQFLRKSSFSNNTQFVSFNHLVQHRHCLCVWTSAVTCCCWYWDWWGVVPLMGDSSVKTCNCKSCNKVSNCSVVSCSRTALLSSNCRRHLVEPWPWFKSRLR